MNASELRLGNWVDPKFPMQVISIYKDEILCNFEGNESDPWDFAPKDLEGIPLTDEWLVEFGATQDQFDLEAFCLSSLTFDYYIIKNTMLDGSIYWMIDELRGNTCIQYVHQLQNLYFALTGKEL